MTSKELTFQPGKFTSTLTTRKKKKAFGRRNNNTKVQSILASTTNNNNTTKRIPMEIGIKEKKQNITPKEQLTGTSTRQQNNINNNNTGISKGMSSLTAPTALKGGYSNRYTLAAAAANNAAINDGDELSFNEEEEYDTNHNTKKKNNNELASTRKRLSYGMGEGVVSNNNKKNNASLVGKKKGNEKNKDEDKSKLVKQQQGEQSKKRSRSGELRRMSKSAGQSATTARKDGRDKKRGETSIQQKTIITTRNPFTKKSQRTSSYHAPLPTKKSIIVRTKSSSHNVIQRTTSGSNNNKLNQRELLKLAKSNNGTVIQYHATKHYGDSITDKNFSSSSSNTKSNDYLIENGDLVIQQDCANVKGTYWTSKFGFRHWKLPGVRSSRGVSIYTSTRPLLADDKGSGASGDKKKKGGGVNKRPLLTLDTSLSTQHDRLVRRFVKEARAGQTPFDFFPENELDDDKEGDDWQCKEEDEGDFGGDGDGFSFNDDGLAPSSDKSAEEQEEEDEEDQRPAKRKAFGDRSNTLPRVHVPPPTQKTKTITKPRTKSARKKRKSSDTQATLPSTASSSCSSKKRPRTSIQFSVPSFGQEEEGGGYQDQVHWGLIEGMGGGEEECDNSSLPHRGRILEIPGVVMPGKWETNLLYDYVEEDEDEDCELDSLRLSLRHNTASSLSLETFYTGKEDSPNGLTVSLLDTSSNRVDDFVKQGVLSEDEVDFCVDGGKVTNDSFLSCLSLVTFGGFMSSSAATNEANKMTRSLLAGCTTGRRASQNGLHKIVGGGEHDETDLGVLFPCKLGFDNKYSFLIQHDAKFRVTAIDVIFRQLEASAQNTGLTTTMLSDHQADVGSGSELIMERFMEYPFKRNYQLPGTIIEKDKVQKKYRVPTNEAEEPDDNVDDDDEEEEVVSPQKPVDEATEHVSSAEDEGDAEEQEISVASVESKEHAGSDDLSVTLSHDKDQDANEQEEAKVVNPPSSIGDGNEEPNITDLVQNDEQSAKGSNNGEEEEMSFGGGDRDPFEVDEPEIQVEKANKLADKQDKKEVPNNNELGEDCIKNNGDTSKPNQSPSPKIGKAHGQQTEVEQSNEVGRKKLLTAETLTAAYEDFERNRKTTQITSISKTINSNSQPLVVLEDSGDSNNQSGQRLSSRMSMSDWRRPLKNRKVVIVEDDIIDESLLGPRPVGTNAHRQRRNSTGNIGRLHKVTKGTAARKNRHSLPAVTTTKPSVKKLPTAVSTSKKQCHMKKKPLRREVTLEAVEAPKSAPQLQKTKSILKKSNRRKTHEPTTSKSNAVSSFSSTKNRRVSLNLKPLVKPTKVNDVDLLDDSNSLFGCGVRSYAKTPNARKNNNSRLLKKYSSRKKFGSGVSHTPSHKSSESDTVRARSSVEPKKAVQSSSQNKRRTSLRSVNTSRRSKSSVSRGSNSSATRSQRDEATDIDPINIMGEHESTISSKEKTDDTLLHDDDTSVHSTGGSFHCEEEIVISPTPSDTESFTQPLHDVYFGHDGSNQSASQSTSSSIDACVDGTDAQNFHDCFYGQEVINGEESCQSNGQPLHDVFFGLDSNDSLPELDFNSLVDQTESSTLHFHDSYFGKEPNLVEDDESRNEAEVVMMTRSPKRCVMQSNRLLVGVLLALWVQASY